MTAVAPTRPIESAPRIEASAATAALRSPIEAPASERKAGKTKSTPASAPVDAAQLLATAGSDLGALSLASSLPERFRVLDEIARRAPELLEPVLEALLNSELPGTPYEAETLRLAILGKVAQVPGAQADAVLVASLDPGQPRQERLLALEGLAPRPNAGRPVIEALAQQDPDSVVQEKARAVLARAIDQGEAR